MSKVDRKYELVIYPDDPKSGEYLSKAKALFEEWAYCLHDSDILEDGSPKKPHIHFLGHFSRQLTLHGVAYQIGCPDNMVSYVHDYRAAARYLVHADNSTKHQYDVESIVSNYDISSYFVSKPKEEDMIHPIIEHIYANPYESITDLTRWVLDNHYWSAFRRSYSILKDIRLHEEVDQNLKRGKKHD